MEAVTFYINESVLEALSLTLLHFVWQGGLVAGILYVLLNSINKKRAVLRYNVSLGAMLLNLIAPILTFLTIYQPSIASPKTTSLFTVTGGTVNIEAASSFSLSGMLPWLSMVWFAGVIYFSLRLIYDMVQVYRLPYLNTVEPSAKLEALFSDLASILKVNSYTRLVVSMSVEVPMVIGWLKPVVLLPASMASGLSTKQLEMLLAHELAHVVRYDYFVNFLQSLVEIVLFYHPCVKWVSKQVRVEREYCCDDIAVHQCGNAIAYATTLADAEQLRSTNIPQMAMAATGGDLKGRVIRMVADDNTCAPKFSGQWLAGVTSFTFATFIFGASHVVGMTNSPAVAPIVERINQALLFTEETELALTQMSLVEQEFTLSKKEFVEPTAKEVITRADNESVLPIVEEVAKPNTEITEEPVVSTPVVNALTVNALTVNALTANESTANESTADESTADVATENESKLAQGDAQIEPQTNVDSVANRAVTRPKLALSELPVEKPLISKITSETIDIASLPVVSSNITEPKSIDTKTALPKTAPQEAASHEVPPLKVAQVVEDSVEKVMPTLLRAKLPGYPSSAIERNIESEVKVKFDINLNGRVENVVFEAGVEEAFQNAVKKALRKWRFKPGSVDGEKTKMQISKIFSFKNPRLYRSPVSTGTRIVKTNMI